MVAGAHGRCFTFPVTLAPGPKAGPGARARSLVVPRSTAAAADGFDAAAFAAASERAAGAGASDDDSDVQPQASIDDFVKNQVGHNRQYIIQLALEYL